MRSRLRGSRLAVSLVLLAGLGLAACDRPQAQGDAKAGQAAVAAPNLPSVTVSQPLIQEIVDWDEYTGRFDAIETVEVRARVSGYLNEVVFTDGQEVKKGDLLYIIDPRSFERALEQAKAELAQAQVKADNLVADVERGKPLVERKIMSEKTYEDRANLLREAQAAVKVSEAKVATAELERSFTRIEAPIGGRIGRTSVSEGNWVSAGGVSNATLLTTIVSQDPIHAYFDVSENNYIKYKRLRERGEGVGAADLGARVELALTDERGFPHEGRLDFLDNRLDQGTGTLRARAVVSNSTGLFSPGMFVRLRVTGSPRYTALLLPDESIGTDQTNKYVLTVGEDGTVARRTVQLGLLVDGFRVVRGGLKNGEWVVTKGLHRARPGGKVAPNRVALTVAKTSAARETVSK